MNSKPIPATELVKRLQKAIERFGNYDVIIQLPDGTLCDDFEMFFSTMTLNRNNSMHLKHKQYFVGSQTQLFKIKCR